MAVSGRAVWRLKEHDSYLWPNKSKRLNTCPMKRIIIVEDDFILAIMLEKEIQQLGHEVAAKLGSAEEAIAIVKKNDPDLVLMEIRLYGDMDGIEAMTQIRKFSDVPVIYMASNSFESTKKRAMETNPAGYLTKPLNTKVFKELISKTFDENQ